MDTVGFIHKLPHSLVAAFRATLEEVVEADLLLHVMDASADDFVEREEAVNAVLSEIGAESRPRIDVLNKIDALTPARRDALIEGRPGAALVSALTGEGMAGLREHLSSHLALDPKPVRLRVAERDSRTIASIYRAGRVLRHEVENGEALLEVEIPERLVHRYRGFLA